MSTCRPIRNRNSCRHGFQEVSTKLMTLFKRDTLPQSRDRTADTSPPRPPGKVHVISETRTPPQAACRASGAESSIAKPLICSEFGHYQFPPPIKVRNPRCRKVSSVRNLVRRSQEWHQIFPFPEHRWRTYRPIGPATAGPTRRYASPNGWAYDLLKGSITTGPKTSAHRNNKIPDQ